MSNQAVGGVYAKIIQDVIETSQVDFEEQGVRQEVLDKLRSLWQGKLSSIRVAQFPWDPTPAPEQSGTPSSSAPVKKQSSSDATPVQTPPAAASSSQPVKQEIKKEAPSQPTSQSAGYPTQAAQPSLANLSARDRAAAALQQKFGNQAASQISKLQGQPGAPPSQSAAQSTLYNGGQDVKPSLASLQAMQQAQSSTLGTNQTDGAGDSLMEWKAEVEQRRLYATEHPGEGDRLLRGRLLALQQRMEAGGLFMPIDERQSPQSTLKRKVKNSRPEDLIAGSSSSGVAEEQHTGIGERKPRTDHAQYDGPDDDDDDDDVKLDGDEDAINSDLDDPDDLNGDPSADDDTDQAMLCTYDKVQRVKNKWKCTLKDGILKVDGKEYVFHKGQGEFEW